MERDFIKFRLFKYFLAVSKEESQTRLFGRKQAV